MSTHEDHVLSGASPTVGETSTGDEFIHDEVAPQLEAFGGAALDSSRLRRARARSIKLALGLLLIVNVLGWSLMVSRRDPWFQPFDDWWRELMITHRFAAATALAKALSVVGSVFVTVPLRLGVAITLGVRRRWIQLAAFTTAIITSEILIGVLKAVVDRSRPPEQLVLSTSSSFPSGHAIATAVTALGIVVAFFPRGRRRWHWIIIATTVAGLMSISRTYLSVHWATDTIAGTALGVACAILAEALFEGGRHTAAVEAVEIGEVGEAARSVDEREKR